METLRLERKGLRAQLSIPTMWEQDDEQSNELVRLRHKAQNASLSVRAERFEDTQHHEAWFETQKQAHSLLAHRGKSLQRAHVMGNMEGVLTVLTVPDVRDSLDETLVCFDVSRGTAAWRFECHVVGMLQEAWPLEALGQILELLSFETSAEVRQESVTYAVRMVVLGSLGVVVFGAGVVLMQLSSHMNSWLLPVGALVAPLGGVAALIAQAQGAQWLERRKRWREVVVEEQGSLDS